MNETKNSEMSETLFVRENIVAGAVGAFLFALVGGVLWYAFYMMGFLAGISGLIGAVCAIKGYEVFAKKESTKGVIIGVIMALVVIVVAWYLCLAHDVYEAYQMWYAEGDVDFTLTFFESVRVAHNFLADPEIAPAYFGDLIIGLLLCISGAGSYIVRKAKKVKNSER